MKASQTETVIMLTCCALQSACYSPTGIVISFILAQFQGEVQTNLTVKRAKNALSTGRDDLECPPLSGCGTQHPLRALGGTCVLLAAAPTTPPCFRRWRRSSSLHFGHFQRKNHLIFRVSGKSAELVGAKPLHLLTQTALPLKSPTGAFIAAQTRTIPNPFSREGS